MGAQAVPRRAPYSVHCERVPQKDGLSASPRPPPRRFFRSGALALLGRAKNAPYAAFRGAWHESWLELNRTPMSPSNPLNASFRKSGSRLRRPPINPQPSPRTREESRTNRCTGLDRRNVGSFEARLSSALSSGEYAVDAHAVDATPKDC